MAKRARSKKFFEQVCWENVLHAMKERKTLVRTADSESRRRERSEKRSRDVSSVVLLQSLMKGLEKPDLFP
jgi:hypothetical protein